MKQVLDAACQGIDPTQIRPPVKVATMACEREIIDVVCAAVLSGHHMLDMMYEFAVALVKPTILAPLFGSLSDEPPGSGVNH
jgi:hypothetical protein